MKRILLLALISTFICTYNCTNKMYNPYGYYTIDSIAGKWFVPHAAFNNIILKDDSSYDFSSYDTLSCTMVCQKGIYKIADNKIILSFHNKKQIIVLNIERDCIGNYYLKNDDYYFVKE